MIFITIRRHQGLYFNGPLSPVKSKMACDHCNGKKVSVIFCIAWRAFCVWGRVWCGFILAFIILMAVLKGTTPIFSRHTIFGLTVRNFSPHSQKNIYI